MNNTYLLLATGVIALVTAALRFLPFAVFSGNRKTPPLIEYLGHVLPYAVMGMLVIYCLKDTDFVSGRHGLPEAAAVAVTSLLHIRKRSTILSIVGGTAVYMLLIRIIPA